MYNFLLKLLVRDQGVMRLLDKQNGDPWASNREKENDLSTTHGVKENSNCGHPKYIRVEKYRYKFNEPGANISKDGKEPFWVRERVGRYFPMQGVVGVDDLRAIVAHTIAV